MSTIAVKASTLEAFNKLKSLGLTEKETRQLVSFVKKLKGGETNERVTDFQKPRIRNDQNYHG